jgi:hypothetical protein
MTGRNEEIDELMAVQNQMILADRERVERIALSQRTALKVEGLAGRKQIRHAATCRYCASRIVDCLPEDKMGCSRFTERESKNAALTVATNETPLED